MCIYIYKLVFLEGRDGVFCEMKIMVLLYFIGNFYLFL